LGKCKAIVSAGWYHQGKQKEWELEELLRKARKKRD
jgi:hypothetical protein